MKFEEAREIILKEVQDYCEKYRNPKQYNTVEYSLGFHKLNSYDLVKNLDEMHRFHYKNDSIYMHHKEQYAMLQRYKELMGEDFPKSYYTYIEKLEKIGKEMKELREQRSKRKITTLE